MVPSALREPAAIVGGLASLTRATREFVRTAISGRRRGAARRVEFSKILGFWNQMVK